MKATTIIWQVVTRILGIVVVLVLFGAATSPFETAVIAGLVLIYTAVEFSKYALLRVAMGNEVTDEARYHELLGRTGAPPTESDQARLHRDLKAIDFPGWGWAVNVGTLYVYLLIALARLAMVALR